MLLISQGYGASVTRKTVSQGIGLNPEAVSTSYKPVYPVTVFVAKFPTKVIPRSKDRER